MSQLLHFFYLLPLAFFRLSILSVDIPPKNASRSNWSYFPAPAVFPNPSLYCGECDCFNYDLFLSVQIILINLYHSVTATCSNLRIFFFFCVMQLEACAHPFFDELREPNAQLPDGRPFPPLFNFKQEVSMVHHLSSYEWRLQKSKWPTQQKSSYPWSDIQ